jgi:microcystin-dependent protein
MSDPFVAEIRMFAGNFPPKGWATCDGQLLPISQNTALFSLLGTYYGGDGKSTFALPNLEGSAPLGQGQGAGLAEYFLGQVSGTDFITLLTSEIPIHTHFAKAHAFDFGDQASPTTLTSLAKSNNGASYTTTTNLSTAMAFQALSLTGGSLPHNNMSPYLVVTFIIAMQGVFPPRG